MAKGLKTGGRRKGSTNKVTKSVADIIDSVFNKLGGSQGLYDWANASEDNKDLFYTKIWAKRIPRNIDVNVDATVRLEELVAGSMKPEKKE